MKKIEYTPVGVCARKISFVLDDDNIIHDVEFIGGCNGNLKAISKLVENKNANEIATLLKGNICGMKNTSCADQLAKALIQSLEENK